MDEGEPKESRKHRSLIRRQRCGVKRKLPEVITRDDNVKFDAFWAKRGMTREDVKKMNRTDSFNW
jgi:hypothetical protein